MYELCNGLVIEDVNWRDEGVGMGIYRLSLVKLGCWMNINVFLVVSEVLYLCLVVLIKF